MCGVPTHGNYQQYAAAARKMARERAIEASKCADLREIEAQIRPGDTIGDVLLRSRNGLSETARSTVNKLLRLEGL